MNGCAKRIVVKVGSSTLTHPSGLLNIRRMEELCRVLSDLKNAGNEMVLVSSGAIAMGRGVLKLPKGRLKLEDSQAAAAVGQIALAKAWAEVLGAQHIYVGVNAVDYSGYPDCRPEFVEAFEHTARLATRAGVEGAAFSIRAPLMRLTKAEIIRQGTELGVDYSLTWSCYDPAPAGVPCGRCDSCQLRARGFAEAGLADPLLTHR